MTAALPEPTTGRGSKVALEWSTIAAEAPVMADTMARYQAQTATFLSPLSIDVADATLRRLALWLIATTQVRAVAASFSPVERVPRRHRGTPRTSCPIGIGLGALEERHDEGMVVRHKAHAGYGPGPMAGDSGARAEGDHGQREPAVPESRAFRLPPTCS